MDKTGWGATAAEWKLVMEDRPGKLRAVFLDAVLAYQE